MITVDWFGALTLHSAVDGKSSACHHTHDHRWTLGMVMAMAMCRFYMLCLRLLSASGYSVAIYSLCLGCSFNKLYQYDTNGNRQGIEVFACFAFENCDGMFCGEQRLVHDITNIS